MAAVWMLLCVLTVCLARGIYLFDNCIEDEGIMFDLTACFLSTVSGFPADLSPNEISLKKAFALFQTIESMLDQDAREVQLENNEVEAQASGHQNPEQKPQCVNETTNVQNQVVTKENGTAGEVQNRVVIRGNSDAGRDLKWVIIGGDSTTEDVQNRVVIRGNATAGGVQNLVIIKDKAKTGVVQT
ncbi:hypothetical protein F7725_013834 [Dissostichus mawsoni]|uniref:Uncharacterized protein n=1 Tax=Dissostichus mawsoni TaxID=36200 RepID=A0A7J5YUM1_DISMA|nr:hypothetical protein F7725_013834 [Dissostichus mawsoni]